MSSTRHKYAGTIKAAAYYGEDGAPKLNIDLDEMERIRRILVSGLGREPTVLEVFEYVYQETRQ